MRAQKDSLHISNVGAEGLAIVIECLNERLSKLEMPDYLRPFKPLVVDGKLSKEYLDGQGPEYETTPENDLAWKSISSMLLVLKSELANRPTTFLDSFEEFDCHVHNNLALQREITGEKPFSRHNDGSLFVPFMPKQFAVSNMDGFWRVVRADTTRQRQNLSLAPFMDKELAASIDEFWKAVDKAALSRKKALDRDAEAGHIEANGGASWQTA